MTGRWKHKGQVFALAAIMFLCASSFVEAAMSKIDPAVCQMVTKHMPNADVNYQPGVDVHGDAVAPADLPSSEQINLPEKIQVPITVNLAQALNLNTNSYPYNQLGTGTEAVLGTLSVEGDRVSFNGQPLSDAQQDNIAVLCMQPK